MSFREREPLLSTLPQSHRVRGGDVFRRFVFLVDEALQAVERGLDREFETESLLLGTSNRGSGSARELIWRFESGALPVPRVWTGVVAEESDGQLVFRRTLSRALTLAWTEAEFEGCGDAILSDLQAAWDWLPAGTTLSAVVLPEIKPELAIISGRGSLGRSVI